MPSSADALLAAVLVAAALLAAGRLARVSGVPYPVFLVLAGLAVGALPGIPPIRLDPQLVFYGLLPPLVYWTAFIASPEEFARYWRPIAVLTVAGVLVTAAGVAVVAHAVIPGLGWAPALVLGAVVAPTDPLAATAVLQRVAAPRRITAMLQGESLANDGLALTIYGIAVAATVGARLSATSALGLFAVAVASSVTIGVVTGVAARWGRRRLADADAQIVLSLVTPYVAYLLASQLAGSGVLATAVTGLVVGYRSAGLVSAGTRLRAGTFWEVLDFLLNAVLFVLLGAQFRQVLAGLGTLRPWQLAGYALAVCGTVVGLRLATAVLVAPIGRHRFRERLVLGWSGMRGALSLAAALALPLHAGGAAFPDRALLLYLTFTVVLATLVLQGATLPAVLSGLRLRSASSAAIRPARAVLLRAGMDRLDELAQGGIPDSALRVLRERYEERLARAEAPIELTMPTVARAGDYAWREAHAAQREELRRLVAAGQIDTATARELLHELDLEEVRGSLTRGPREDAAPELITPDPEHAPAATPEPTTPDARPPL